MHRSPTRVTFWSKSVGGQAHNGLDVATTLSIESDASHARIQIQIHSDSDPMEVGSLSVTKQDDATFLHVLRCASMSLDYQSSRNELRDWLHAFPEATISYSVLQSIIHLALDRAASPGQANRISVAEAFSQAWNPVARLAAHLLASRVNVPGAA